MKKFRGLLALALAAALVLPAVPAKAESKSKVYVVTQEQDNNGYVTKYSYNKNGLVSKETTTRSYKDSDSDYSSKSVTKYKYNKKNNIASKTNTYESTSTDYDTDSYNNIKAGGTVTTSTSKSQTTTKYKYNKKNLVTEKTSTYVNLSVPTPETGSTITYTATDTGYIRNNSDGEKTEYSNSTVTTTKYTYNKKKQVKTAVTERVRTTVYTYKDATGAVTSTDTDVDTYSGTTSYTYKKGKVSKEVYTPEKLVKSESTYASTGGSTYTSSSVYANGQVTSTSTTKYSDGTTETTTSTRQDTSSVSKNTYTYKYDKKGNLKSSKGKDEYTRYVSYNADGTSLPEDANGNSTYTTYTTVTNTTTKNETAVKGDSKRLTKNLSMSSSKTGRESNKSYGMSRVTYKVKSKKAVKNAEKQQWIIQNGHLNGNFSVY